MSTGKMAVRVLVGTGLAAFVVAVPVVAAEKAAASDAVGPAIVTVPALAAEPEIAAPIQAVMETFGDKHVLAYYTRGAGRCDVVMMLDEEPGPRVRVSLAPEQAAKIEGLEGDWMALTCGAALQMTVERHQPREIAGR